AIPSEGGVARALRRELASIEHDLLDPESAEMVLGQRLAHCGERPASLRRPGARQREVRTVVALLAVPEGFEFLGHRRLQPNERVAAVDAEPEHAGTAPSPEGAGAAHLRIEGSGARGRARERRADRLDRRGREMAEEDQGEVELRQRTPLLVRRETARRSEDLLDGRSDRGRGVDRHEEPQLLLGHFERRRAATFGLATSLALRFATQPSFTICWGREVARAPGGTSRTTVVPAPT